MHRIAKYFITFTTKCFLLALAAGSAELRAILLNKICKIYQVCAALLILPLACGEFGHPLL